MKKKIYYEWTLEFLEDGDIVDNDFSDTLNFDKCNLTGNDIGLVRNKGNEMQGLTDRVWAYVTNNKLPEYFYNEMGEETKYKIPVKFHNELEKYFKS